MADQQFLASFGVDIDESGVSRLQKILAENRTLADSLSASFDVASESVKAFRESISEDFPTLLSGSGYSESKKIVSNRNTVDRILLSRYNQFRIHKLKERTEKCKI